MLSIEGYRDFETELRKLCGNKFFGLLLDAANKFMKLSGLDSMKGVFPTLGVSEEEQFQNAATEVRGSDIRFDHFKRNWSSLDVCLSMFISLYKILQMVC